MLQSSAQMRSLEKSAVADFNFKLASRIAEFSIDFSDVNYSRLMSTFLY